MQQKNHKYDFHVSFGQVIQPSMTLSINYSQNQLNDYSIVLKMKMKEGIDVKTADAEFKERCKSCYTILTSFVKQIRDFLKPTFSLSYHVDVQYAYITFNFANQNDAQDFLAICTYIRETIERSQSSENVSIIATSDLTFQLLSQSIANAIYHMNLQIDGKAEFQKDTIKMMESLINFKKEDMPDLFKNIDLGQILTYLQMLEAGRIEINLDTLNYDIGIPQPNVELPFKFAIYGKLQKFAEQYVDDCIEFELYGPGLSLDIKFQYKGSIFQLIDSILIIKQ